jgi:hypothetical protein
MERVKFYRDKQTGVYLSTLGYEIAPVPNWERSKNRYVWCDWYLLSPDNRLVDICVSLADAQLTATLDYNGKRPPSNAKANHKYTSRRRKNP